MVAQIALYLQIIAFKSYHIYMNIKMVPQIVLPRSDSTTLPWSLGHTSHLGTILIVILVPIRECQE